MRATLYACAVALACAIPAAAGDKKGEPAPTTAEAIRKALDQKITLDYLGQSLQETVAHLREKTKINIILDTFVLQQMGLIVPDGVPFAPQQFVLKTDGGKVRQALQDLLAPMNLTYVTLRDSVVITTEDMAYLRQMRQRVNLDLKGAPVNATLKQLAAETGVNLIIDPAVAKAAEHPVTLQLDDTSLETAVRLLTEMGGMKSVRIGNILFVTTEERATKLRRENNETRPQPGHPGMTFPGFPGGFGGINGGGIAVPALPPPGVAPGQPPMVAPGAGADGAAGAPPQPEKR